MKSQKTRVTPTQAQSLTPSRAFFPLEPNSIHSRLFVAPFFAPCIKHNKVFVACLCFVPTSTSSPTWTQSFHGLQCLGTSHIFIFFTPCLLYRALVLTPPCGECSGNSGQYVLPIRQCEYTNFFFDSPGSAYSPPQTRQEQVTWWPTGGCRCDAAMGGMDQCTNRPCGYVARRDGCTHILCELRDSMANR